MRRRMGMALLLLALAACGGGFTVDNIGQGGTGGSLTRLATYRAPDNTRAVHVAGNLTVIGFSNSGEMGFEILDISTPSLPIRLSHTTLNCTPNDFSVAANRLYVACSNALLIYDIIDPANPGLLATNLDRLADVVAVGNRAYGAGGTPDGLQIYDTTGTPLRLGLYHTSCCAASLFVEGVHAFMANGAGGLQVLDASDPANITLAGQYLANRVDDVTVSNGFAYAAAGNLLAVLDVTDPTAPALRAERGITGGANALFAAGTRLFVVGQQLTELDVTDPVAATVLDTVALTTTGRIHGNGQNVVVTDFNNVHIFAFQ